MDQKIIDNFFTKLSLKIKDETKIILLGGSASLLLGGVRPTKDIDFEIKSGSKPEFVAQSIEKTEKETGVKTEFSENVDHWSMISFLDYQNHTVPYKKFGAISVEILKPEYWSIGKMARFYESDVQDMVHVFTHQKTKHDDLLKVWENALKASPLSDQLLPFKQHCKQFLDLYGKQIWGSQFNLKKIGSLYESFK